MVSSCSVIKLWSSIWSIIYGLGATKIKRFKILIENEFGQIIFVTTTSFVG
jgi:hypothetical protein